MFDKIKKSSRYRWYVLGVVFIGTFMATLDSSIVFTALPTISGDLLSHMSDKQQALRNQWVVTAYLLTISSLLPIFGRISDMLGRKKIYSIGFIIFILGSAMCGFSMNIWFLVGARIIQAIGASMLMANSAAIITATFPQKERGRSLGLIGTIVAFGSITGPALGGVLLLIGWRLIFYINLPIGIIGFILAQGILPHDKKVEQKETFDFWGSFFFIIGMISIIFAINNGNEWGWMSITILLTLLSGILFMIFFIITENKVRHPVIDLSLYKNKPFLIGNVCGWLSFVAMFANNYLLPFYLQNVGHYYKIKLGLLMAGFPFMMALTAPISGHLSDKYGPKLLTTSGLVVLALGLFYYSTVPADASFFRIIPGSLLMGLGSGMFQSPNNSSVMSSVPKRKLGTAGSLNSLVRNVGMVVGIAYSVSIFGGLGGVNKPKTSQVPTFMHAYHTVMLTAMGIALLAALISLNRKSYLQHKSTN